MSTELEKLHLSQLYILKFVDSICQKNNIPYFLDSGTALGAVRHNGFIPWDDDVDIGLLRPDYEKLIKILKETDIAPLYLFSREIEKKYSKYHYKIMIKDTEFNEKFNEKWKYKGIYIDIFPFDNIGKNVKRGKMQIKFSNLFIRFLADRRHGIHQQNKLKSILFFPFLVIPMEWAEHFYYRFCTRFIDKKEGFYTCFAYKMLRNKDLIFDYSVLAPTRTIKFENYFFQIMNDPDLYLRTMYGDYMTLPPENEREVHSLGNIRFSEKVLQELKLEI